MHSARPFPLAILFLILSLSLPSHADPFEGYIHLAVGGFAPIWMDLQVPEADGPITGTYFYKKVGKEISLQGERKGAVIRLTEYGAQRAVTGLFTLTRFEDSLVGTWNLPKDTGKLRVLLHRSAPEYQPYAKMPKPGELILSGGKTLAQEIREGREDAENPQGKGPALDIDFFRKGVIGLSYGLEYMGAYSTSIGVYHTFDLAAKPKREIVLHNEIEPKQRKRFYGLLRRRIQAELAAHRKTATDEEWHSLFEARIQEDGGDPDSLLNDIFLMPEPRDTGPAEIDTSTQVQEQNDTRSDHYHFTEQGLQYHVSHYWGFPHVIQAQDFYCQIDFSFAELKPYLKQGSPLARFAP